MKSKKIFIFTVFLYLLAETYTWAITPSMHMAAIKTITTTTVSTSQDDAIVSAVYARYARSSALIGTQLTVSSDEGIVTISGTVTSQSQADEAMQVAKSIAGVRDVRSAINVTTNPQGSIPQPLAPNY